MASPKILVLGGTGAMGSFLVPILSNKCNVFVTSRSERESSNNVTYIKGNAHDLTFLEELLVGGHYHAIIDFMHYSTSEYAKRYTMLLDSTDQLFFMSSSRVYAEHHGKITEECPRLLDVSKDKDFLITDDYALAKARQEDILRKSGRKNWTIIRPYMTYSPYRMDWGFYPKELWLYRVLKGRSVLFPKDVASNLTTLTYGLDVANAIACLVGHEAALGETFNVTNDISYTWREVIEAYKSAIESRGYEVRIKYIDRPIIKSEYIYRYDRAFHRQFDNSKIRSYTNIAEFTDTMKGVKMCVNMFLDNPHFRNADWRNYAYWDRELNEVTPPHEISTIKDKAIYTMYRYIMPPSVDSALRPFMKKIINKIK